MNKIVSVQALEGYRLELAFLDGTHGIVDVSDMVGRGVFALWNDEAAFRDVRIGEGGELVWHGSVDLCPDSLYLQVTGKNPEDIFPSLKGRNVHA